MRVGFAFGPLFFDGFTFFEKVFAHAAKGFDEGFDTQAEFGAREVLVDEFHLRLLALAGLAGGGEVDEAVAQQQCDGEHVAGVDDPDGVDEIERFDAFGQHAADEDGDFGFGEPLVVAQFGEPAVLPGLGALGFPEDGAASGADGQVDAVEDIAAVFAFGDGFEFVVEELFAQQGFQLPFEGFALQFL